MTRFCLLLALLGTVATASASETNLQLRYLRSLEPWVKAAVTEIHRISPDSVVFGLGYDGHWYQQTHGAAFSAFAVLATDPNTDESRTGMSREEMRKTALDMLRYALRSHKAGGGMCTNGQPWGHSWISSLNLERMSFGIEALDEFLDDELRTLYRKVTESEADYLLKAKLEAGLAPPKNHPESNMWNGIALFRAAILQPEHPHAKQWKERASDYLVNSISVPFDKTNETIVDGKPVKDRFVGANMFESMACNHHGYMNVYYMYTTLSNLAIFHFYCKKNGIEPPEALYHHAERLWETVGKACTFPDGRYIRIGGDTRIRYRQDYGIAVWMLARDRFGDADATKFEHGWINIVNQEQATNPSGWFMKSRLERLAEVSPLYFQRVETDKAWTFAFGAYCHRNFDFDKFPKKEITIPDQWYDEFHGAWFQRGEKRFASWCYAGAVRTTGLCVPSDASDMAEWQFNLAGQVRGMGLQDSVEVRTKMGFPFDGGFATAGCHRTRTGAPVAEGQGTEQTAIVDLACCVLPDDRTMIVIQRAKTEFPTYLKRVRGLSLSVPNDVFNGFTRNIFSDSGTKTLQGIPDKFELAEFPGRWLNVDDKLGVVEIYGGSPKVARVAGRQVEIRGVNPSTAGGLLYVEEICQTSSEGVRFFGANETLFDCAAAILVADSKTTQTSAAKVFKRIEHPSPDVRAVLVTDAFGKQYLIVANFQKETIAVDASQLIGQPCTPLHKKADHLAAFGIGVWKL